MEKDIKLTCIVCPKGCKLTVNKLKDTIEVSGNRCKRGIPYAESEVTNPLRTLTTTVRIFQSSVDCLPVISKTPLPKGLILEAMDVINHTTVHAPIKMGDVIVKNILDTGVDIVSSRSLN